MSSAKVQDHITEIGFDPGLLSLSGQEELAQLIPLDSGDRKPNQLGKEGAFNFAEMVFAESSPGWGESKQREKNWRDREGCETLVPEFYDCVKGRGGQDNYWLTCPNHTKGENASPFLNLNGRKRLRGG